VWPAVVLVFLLATVGPDAYKKLRGEDPSVPAQLKAIRGAAAAENLHVVADRRVHLRSGVDSRLMVLRDDRRHGTQSDEVRVYDELSGALQMMYAFQPDRGGYVFRADRVGDLDGDGRPEVVGSYTSSHKGTTLRVPLAISYRGPDLGYRASSLIKDPPALTQSRSARRLRLFDHHAQVAIRGYPVTDYSVAMDGKRPVLVGGFARQQANHAQHPLLEVQVWSLSFPRGRAKAQQCGLLPGRAPAVAREAGELTGAYRRAAGHYACR
jgi:hypothetical protein